MLCFACFIWLLVFVKVDSNSDRKVKLALETVIKFDQPNLRSDVSLLDNMQTFLNKIRGALNEPDDFELSRRKAQKTAQEKHLVDYLEKALSIVLTYNDEDVRSLARILNEEIQKYHYKGCKFYELANDKMVRKVMRQLLDVLNKAPASVIRLQLTNALNSIKKTNDLDKQVIDFVNSLYSKDSKDKLSRVVNHLQLYKIRARANDGSRGDTLQKVIGDAMKNLVFDHYSSLNDNARRALILHVNAYLVDLFKPNQQEINKLYRWTTRPEEEQTKARVTKTLINSQNMLKEKSYDRSSEDHKLREGTDSDTDAFSDSLNEESEAVTTVKPQVKPSVMEAIRKKNKKVKTPSLKNKKAKRFHTQKNANAMRTIWEEIQTLPPLSSPKTLERSPPKERIIFEEHNAVFNIGSWQDRRRDSSSEISLNLRTGDARLDIDNLNKVDKLTDDEGLTLEFDGKKRSNMNTSSHRSSKNIYSAEIAQLRAVKYSDDSSGDSTSSDKDSKIKDKTNVKKFSDDDDSWPEIDSDDKVTAALALEGNGDEGWNARKLMVEKIKSTERTPKPKLTKMSTMSLSDEDDQLTPTEKLKEVTPEENAKDNKIERPLEEFDVIKRRDNDKYENTKTYVKLTRKNVKASEKIDDDKNSDSEFTKSEHMKGDDASEKTITLINTSYTTPYNSVTLLELETTTEKSSESDSKEEKPVSAKGNERTATESELTNRENNKKMRFYAKETTEEFKQLHDEKLKGLAKELDEAGEKTRRHLGSAENGVKDKAFSVLWEDNELV